MTVSPFSSRKLGDFGEFIAASIVHLPDVSLPYHSQRMEVVKLSLLSMRAGAQDVQIVVWDNGSCPELRDWLANEYKPDRLILSANIGKTNARKSIFGMFPSETVIAIADDDMFFYPDWYKESLELLLKFPNVGQVTGYPTRIQFRFNNSFTLSWAEANAKLDAGRYIPEEWEFDFAESVGIPWEQHDNRTLDEDDYRIEYNGLQAYATAHHCQFMGYAGTLYPLMNWSDETMPDEKPFEAKINAAGLLRLATIQRYTRHMGNVIDDRLRKDINKVMAVKA
jgi:hypothetical protein